MHQGRCALSVLFFLFAFLSLQTTSAVSQEYIQHPIQNDAESIHQEYLIDMLETGILVFADDNIKTYSSSVKPTSSFYDKKFGLGHFILEENNQGDVTAVNIFEAAAGADFDSESTDLNDINLEIKFRALEKKFYQELFNQGLNPEEYFPENADYHWDPVHGLIYDLSLADFALEVLNQQADDDETNYNDTFLAASSEDGRECEDLTKAPSESDIGECSISDFKDLSDEQKKALKAQGVNVSAAENQAKKCEKAKQDADKHKDEHREDIEAYEQALEDAEKECRDEANNRRGSKIASATRRVENAKAALQKAITEQGKNSSAANSAREQLENFESALESEIEKCTEKKARKAAGNNARRAYDRQQELDANALDCSMSGCNEYCPKTSIAADECTEKLNAKIDPMIALFHDPEVPNFCEKQKETPPCEVGQITTPGEITGHPTNGNTCQQDGKGGAVFKYECHYTGNWLGECN